MRRAIAQFAAVLLCGNVLSIKAASEWRMFRGNSALSGISESILPAKPALLWKFKTGAAVKSSAIIADGKVFFGSSDTNIYALDLRTGKKLWAYKTTGGVEAPGLFANGKFFIGSTDDNLYALDANTGKLLWKYQTEAKILGAPNLVAASRESAADSSKDMSAALSRDAATSILIGSYDFRLHCVDAATGKSNWVYETGNYINGSPAIADGKTVFGGCDGLLHVISVADGKQIKEIEAGAYVAASVSLADNRAYFGHYENQFLCIDLSEGRAPQVPENGTEKNGTRGTRPSEKSENSEPNSPVVWSYKNRDFPYLSSAAVTEDRVVFGGRDKLLHCLNRANGHKIWTFATQGKVDSSPVVAGDKVVFGSDDGRVYLVSLQTGKELWSYEIGQPIDSSPAVADGKIVIGSDDGNVYCFGEKKK